MTTQNKIITKQATMKWVMSRRSSIHSVKNDNNNAAKSKMLGSRLITLKRLVQSHEEPRSSLNQDQFNATRIWLLVLSLSLSVSTCQLTLALAHQAAELSASPSSPASQLLNDSLSNTAAAQSQQAFQLLDYGSYLDEEPPPQQEQQTRGQLLSTPLTRRSRGGVTEANWSPRDYDSYSGSSSLLLLSSSSSSSGSLFGGGGGAGVNPSSSAAGANQRRRVEIMQTEANNNNGGPALASLAAGSQSGAKMGPLFTVEPVGSIYYLNSTDLVIPCAASGNPEPIITWWHRGTQLEGGSLLDKRYVRYDNALVISAFKGHEFQQDIHSTAYKCEASNIFGTIASRDVVINAVIDQEPEPSVADQFVSADSDALFRCQLPGSRVSPIGPAAGDPSASFLEVVGWLEEGGSGPGAQAPLDPRKMSAASAAHPPPRPTPIHLAEGQLLVPRVQLRDSRKSYRCQVRNLLSGKLTTSPIGGRLFVTDTDDQSGSAPRLIEAPRPLTIARPGDSLQVACVAQGSPRPSVRWFRQRAKAAADSSAQASGLGQQQPVSPGGQSIVIDSNEWNEIASSPFVASSAAPSPGGQKNQLQPGSSLLLESRIQLLAEGSILQIKSIQLGDRGLRFKCLANNSFGQQAANTELRLDAWPPNKLVELEPKLEFLSPGPRQQQHQHATASKQQMGNSNQIGSSLVLNCTVRALASQPLMALEWLRNGRSIFAVSSSSANQESASIGGQPTYQMSEQSSQHSHNDSGPSLFEFSNEKLESLAAASDGGAKENPSSFELEGPPAAFSLDSSSTSASDGGDQSGPANWPSSSRQLVRKLSQETLLYQLHLLSLRRSDKGAYQCRARYARSLHQATGHLMLRDQAPQFVDSFPSQLINPVAPGGGGGGSGAHNHAHNHNSQQHQSAVSLKCIASGSPLPEISWSLSGFPIAESSRIRVGDYVTRDGFIISFVNISQVQVEDGGLYECCASNDAGQLRHAAWLNVTGPAHIRPMGPMSAIAGRSFQLMCPVGGWPIDSISWFQNATKLPTNHRQKLFPNGTIVISDLNEVTDSGQYSCQAKQLQQSQSPASDLVAVGHLQLSIKVPPVVEPFQFAKSLHRSQRYNVMCTVVRGDLPVLIRWFKDGIPLEETIQTTGTSQLMDSSQSQPNSLGGNSEANSGAQVAIKQLDPYSSTLTFSSLQSQHRGSYTCEAQNEAGRANQSSSLVIHVPPEWRIEPRDAATVVGRTAVIDCQADSFPAARIEWRLSQDLYREPPSEFKPIISSLYMRVFENGSLIIYNTQRTDAGYYLCQATNGVGPGLSRVIKLTVNVAAHFKSKIRTELVRRGQSTKLRCESIGDPPIEISWLRDKQPLYLQDEPRYSVTRSSLPDGHLSELFIAETERSDSALFTCISQNQFGNDDTNIQLLVQGPPDPPLDVRVTEIESRSARVNWLPGHTGNSPIQRYTLSYTTSSSPSSSLLLVHQQHAHHPHSSGVGADLIHSLAQDQGSAHGAPIGGGPLQYHNISVQGNETSVLLSPLIPLTDYLFFLVAHNQLGLSSRVSSNELIRFRTQDEGPASPLTAIKAQAVSSRSLKVRFRLPERRTHFGLPTGVYLGYKLLKLPATPASSSSSSADSSKLDSSASSSNEQQHHNQMQHRESGNPSSQAVAKSNQANNNQDTGLVTFRTIEVGNPHQTTLGSDGSNQTGAATSGGQEQECLLTGLKRGQRYLITLQPFNARGTGPASEPIVVETWRVDVPDAPTLRLVYRSSRSVHLAWRVGSNSASSDNDSEEPPSSKIGPSKQNESAMASRDSQDEDPAPSEPILAFLLTRKQLPSSIDQLDGPIVETKLPGEHLSQMIENLQCGTRYQFTISAINSVGSSAPSEPLTVKTEGSVPVAPDKNSLLSLNSSSLSINLAAWHNGACPMRSFEVLFKPSKSPKWTPLTVYQVGANQQQQQQLSKSPSLHSSMARDLANSLAGLSGQSLESSPSIASSQTTQMAQTSTAATNQTIVIDNLTPVLNYDLKIIAINEAGTTEAYYTFNTNLGIRFGRPPHGAFDADTGSSDTLWAAGDETGYRLGSHSSLADFLQAPGSLASWLLLCVLIAAVCSATCIFLARRRNRASNSSNCSLSLSTGSRTNRSSSNYYDTSAKTSTSATGSSALCQQKTNMGQPAMEAAQQHLLWQQQQQAHALDLYGTSRGAGQQQQHQTALLGSTAAAAHLALMVDKSPSSSHPTPGYGFSRPLLEDTSDLTSVLGTNSDAEMCLGASALNLGQQQQQQQAAAAKQPPNRQAATEYYVSRLMAHQQQSDQHQQQQQLSKLLMSQTLGKSSTLPPNCHPNQVLLLSNPNHQNAAHQSNEQQQQAAMLESLVANQMLQQQHQEHQLQMHCQDPNNFIGTAEDLALLEHQLQHQVYATVKRGCPKPPQLRDYSIYQCPQATVGPRVPAGTSTEIHNNDSMQMMRCCGHDMEQLASGGNEQSAQETNEQITTINNHNNNNNLSQHPGENSIYAQQMSPEETMTVNLANGAQLSDYQQLR